MFKTIPYEKELLFLKSFHIIALPKSCLIIAISHLSILNSCLDAVTKNDAADNKFNSDFFSSLYVYYFIEILNQNQIY